MTTCTARASGFDSGIISGSSIQPIPPELMQFVKANLKEAKAALAAGRFEETQYYAEAVLESDASNYMALLLLGKAKDRKSVV